MKKCFNNYLFTVSYNSFSSVSISFIHILTDASLGIRQSPRGESATLPTFGPSAFELLCKETPIECSEPFIDGFFVVVTVKCVFCKAVYL